MATTTTEPQELTPQERITMIKRNLKETMSDYIIDDVILKENRAPVIYWGTATTGRPHCGYFVPVLKLGDFLRAGCHVKILLADVHAFLDAMKAPIELVEYRAEYYKYCITALLQAVRVPLEKLEFVMGRSYQLGGAYTMDLYKICCVVSEHDAKKAGSEVVKQEADAKLSGMIYPLMQALDEEHLGVDAQFGGVDQRKIFALATESLPKIGFKKRAHLMNPMVPGLQGGKMSASDPDSKIDLLDAPDVVRKKLKKAFGTPKVVEGNGLLSFVEFVLLPAGVLKYGEPRFVVERTRDNLEPLVYNDIAKMNEDYAADILTPQLLKPAVAEALIELLAPIQEAFSTSQAWQANEKQAYPPPIVEKKKTKEKKDRGTRFPGNAKPEVPIEKPAEEITRKVEDLQVESIGEDKKAS